MGESTTTTLEKEVMEAIQKNLPAQVAGVLKGQLEELDRLRNVDIRYAQSEKQLREAKDAVALWEGRAKKLEEREARVSTLQDNLDSEMRKLEVQILKIKLEEAEKRSAIGQDLVSKVFANRRIVESVLFDHGCGFGNPGYPAQSVNGNYGPPPSPGKVQKTTEEV